MYLEVVVFYLETSLERMATSAGTQEKVTLCQSVLIQSMQIFAHYAVEILCFAGGKEVKCKDLKNYFH